MNDSNELCAVQYAEKRYFENVPNGDIKSLTWFGSSNECLVREAQNLVTLSRVKTSTFNGSIFVATVLSKILEHIRKDEKRRQLLTDLVTEILKLCDEFTNEFLSIVNLLHMPANFKYDEVVSKRFSKPFKCGANYLSIQEYVKEKYLSSSYTKDDLLYEIEQLVMLSRLKFDITDGAIFVAGIINELIKNSDKTPEQEIYFKNLMFKLFSCSSEFTSEFFALLVKSNLSASMYSHLVLHISDTNLAIISEICDANELNRIYKFVTPAQQKIISDYATKSFLRKLNK